jgi:hypothetical protein
MKSLPFSKLITLVLAMLVAGSVFAASNHKGSLQVFDRVQVNGKQLPAGDYTVTWDGEGPNVNVNIVRDGKVMATTAATIVPLEQKSEQDAAEFKTNSTGTRNLTAILFSGKKYKLALNGDAGQGADKSGDAMK